MDLNSLLGLSASLLVGLSLGLVGAGGSLIVVPILVYLLRLSPHAAVGVSLAVVAVTSSLGTCLQARRGAVALRGLGFFAIPGALGALAGARINPLLPERALLFAFAVLMMAVAAAMFLAREPQPREAPPARPIVSAAAGLGTGLITGTLGVGGGFLIVPALMFLVGLPARKAIGTSLAVIALNSFVALLGHLDQGQIQYGVAATVAAASVIGLLVGTTLWARLPQRTLRLGFAGLSATLAVVVVIRTAAW